ncbi:MAG: hypothetical protein ACJARQ_000342 [Oleispira sp.]|jgi:hypothetical protein
MKFIKVGCLQHEYQTMPFSLTHSYSKPYNQSNGHRMAIESNV